MDRPMHPDAIEAIRNLANTYKANADSFRRTAPLFEGHEAAAERHADIARSLYAVVEKETRRRAYFTLRALMPYVHAENIRIITSTTATRSDRYERGKEVYLIHLTAYVDPMTGEERWALEYRDEGGGIITDHPNRADAEYRYEEMLEIFKGGQP